MSQARAPSRVKRYAAFLRGVSPMNAKMPELKKAFEVAGFADVRTVLSSGNVVFSAPAASESAIERKAEAAMQKCLGSAFPTIVRSIDALRRILASDPYANFQLKLGTKRVVTFVRGKPKIRLNLPIEFTGELLVADKFIHELYVHMGFQSAWKFETVHELVISHGTLLDTKDISRQMAQVREQMTRANK